MQKKKNIAMAMLAGASVSSAALGGFDSGDLVVMQLGGTSSTAQTVTLLDYDLSGSSASLRSSVTLPSAGTSALTLSGTGAHDGHLNLSADGNYLTLGGYRADVGAINPITQSAAAVNRVIGVVDSNWNVDTSTALTDAFNATEFEAVASTNGKQFWVAGDIGSVASNYTTAGLRYVSALGATTTTNLSQTQNTTSTLQPDSLRNVKVVNNQVYVLTASQTSFGNRGLYATATPLPTSGAQTMIPVMNNLEGNSTSQGQELGPDSTGKLVPKTDVVFADLSPSVPGYDTAYTTGGKADYEKWSLIANPSTGSYSWLQVATFALTGFADINALALTTSGSQVNLFVANSSGIYDFPDNSGYIATQPQSASFTINSFTPIITAPAGTQFRGIAAVPEPATLAILAALGLLPLSRRRRVLPIGKTNS